MTRTGLRLRRVGGGALMLVGFFAPIWLSAATYDPITRSSSSLAGAPIFLVTFGVVLVIGVRCPWCGGAFSRRGPGQFELTNERCVHCAHAPR